MKFLRLVDWVLLALFVAGFWATMVVDLGMTRTAQSVIVFAIGSILCAAVMRNVSDKKQQASWIGLIALALLSLFMTYMIYDTQRKNEELKEYFKQHQKR